MATTSLLVAVGLAGLVFLVLGEMPRRAQAHRKPWMRDPEAHPRWHIRDTYRDIGIALLTGAVVGSVFFVAEETREEERVLRAEIVENTRFVRQLSIEFPQQPKPLTGTILAGASLAGLKLTGADLSAADMTGVSLTEAQLDGADLTDAVLVDADLTEADLTGASLAGADLTGAVLTGAMLTGADLGDVVLDGVCWVESSPPLWPDGFDPPAGGSEACPD
jgi:hypothetical protein